MRLEANSRTDVAKEITDALIAEGKHEILLLSRKVSFLSRLSCQSR